MIHVHWKNFFSLRDGGIVAAVALLTVFGLTAVVSLYGGTGDARPLKHMAGAAIGFGLMLAVGRFRGHHVRAATPLAYAGCLGMMALVLIAGTEVRGTTGWIILGPLSLQPVEFMKLGLVLMLASYFERAHAASWKLIGMSALIAAPPVMLTLLQPDVGSALVLTVIWALFAMLHLSWRERIALILGALMLGVIGWFFVFQEHHRERLRVLIDPSRDPFGAGYNIRQSIIAVGSGRFFGRGLGAGSQSQLQFLPEAATDFAFALIAEELGFAGAFILLATFAMLFARIGFHLARAPDNFAGYVLAGIGGWWAFQTCVYVGMNMGLAPIIGIPLPFVSYGGSSLLASFLAAGCLLVVSNASTAERGV